MSERMPEIPPVKSDEDKIDDGSPHIPAQEQPSRPGYEPEPQPSSPEIEIRPLAEEGLGGNGAPEAPVPGTSNEQDQGGYINPNNI